jgi:hypothetical protein
VRRARLAGLLCLLVAGSATLTACDTSPYAARVNGAVIRQTALNSQLAGWSSNKAWVSAFDAQNSAANGGPGATVEGTGGPGTFSTTFSAGILDGMIVTTAIGQHLAATGNLPNADVQVAARGVRQAELGPIWTGFPPSVRQYIVDELAFEGSLASAPARTSQIEQAYTQFKPYIFYELCLEQVTAFTKQQAEKISSTGNFTGAQVCYDQRSLEAQSPAFFTAVVGLAIGHVTAPVPAKFGFQVAKLISKSSPPFNDSVAKVVAVAVDATVINKQAEAIVGSASVRVNPAYGTWASGSLTPPSQPASAQ